ncbi:hypothetical protein AAFF_G00216910 [Aldrovandia affinis]|uniref:FAM124 domain-containing protein n=1 Tax=Aldrovandia affinis TaxID=143900 RepID=A0AAD7RG09_9TELE|nr:hypothetical protein AAFF_G00216910 [Aldrovandia affinis]
MKRRTLRGGHVDFFTLGPGTPLWAVQQVHYGKEIVQLTVYCRHHSFADMARMYGLLLRRPLAQRREEICFFVIYTEVQLSFKRLPRGQSPAPTEASILEFCVRDTGGLVPLLPRPCTPISETRWQTEDYDGNKILLQVRGSSRYRRRHTITQFTPLPSPLLQSPPLAPPPTGTDATTGLPPPPRSYTLTRTSNLDLRQASKEASYVYFA